MKSSLLHERYFTTELSLEQLFSGSEIEINDLMAKTNNKTFKSSEKSRGM